MSKFSQEDLEVLKKVFDDIDSKGNKNGKVSADELIAALQEANVSFDKEEVAKRAKEADTDGSGEIDFNEFVAFVEKNL